MCIIYIYAQQVYNTSLKVSLMLIWRFNMMARHQMLIMEARSWQVNIAQVLGWGKKLSFWESILRGLVKKTEKHYI